MAYTTINKPTDYFNVVTWTGTSDSTTAVTGVGHQPDFIWIKNRDVQDDHMVYDAVRGGTKRIFTNSAGAEGTESQGIQSFDSDGFTTGSHRATGGDSGNTMVSWNWKAGTSFTNDASATSIGTIDSAGSVSDTSGFSIVTYTAAGAAATIKHGLSSAPKMIFTRKLNGSPNWGVYYGDETDYLELNTTQGTQDDVNMWNDTAPTSSVFSVGGDNKSSGSGNYVAYCFAEKKGYSKFGSYTGNNNADGPFISCGFKPAWVLQKNTSITQGWQLQDNKRLGYNPDNYLLQPHTDQIESALQRVDLLSNGFKVRTTDAGQNGSGNNYIYMAFAEHPFVSSTGTPTTAR